MVLCIFIDINHDLSFDIIEMSSLYRLNLQMTVNINLNNIRANVKLAQSWKITSVSAN